MISVHTFWLTRLQLAVIEPCSFRWCAVGCC